MPPSQLCIALLLQTHDGVSDEEAIDRSAYDLRWKVALGLDISEKLCARYRERVKVAHRIGRCIQLGARQARYLGKTKLAFQIAMIATVANPTLAISQSGFERLLLTLSALFVLVTTGRPMPVLANIG